MATSSSIPALVLEAPKIPIPTCSPNLMPFHIQYSGPAPISTYFRVKHAQSSEPSPNTSGNASSSNAVDVQQDMERITTSDSQATLVSEATASSSSDSAVTLAPTVSLKSLVGNDAGTHLTAAFRGRTVRGTKVDLPEGFAGVVLSAPDGVRGKTATSASAAKTAQPYTRPTRGLSKKKAVEIEDVDDGDEDTNGAPDIVAAPVRTLQAAGTFSSFVLWNPDIPVDEGRDEYLRSLTEWTKIAAEVRG
ncbi:hypothetical protein PHLGIDRAFT_76985 [Phlebiopsis gigantea 11061_1 CR5-6]|uniref:Uncharacterized protein n=1 Tax=Phlebiopsis gigantea (strain 11061_1 CR5-6) TaxID=745531 RepID=A0A0C3PEG9_PHLG1|nr:hypothetical protein PHLGIDRAFT_76985 [Phlebiopsis gigantea 11061_1 CR5-6]